MNKDLNNLFEQARQSLQSDMPIEKVQNLIQGQATTSLWTIQKKWIMNIFIIGAATIGALLFYFNNNATETPQISENQPIVISTTKSISQPDKTMIPIAMPDNIALPMVQKTAQNNLPIANLWEQPIENQAQKATKLDSLEPEKTFTEYKLEIKKENSEQEIKKLKTELAQYGIQMEIKELTYNSENKIKRFKGQFKTDSLFCGPSMSNYEFDISGSFQKMEFIFRVSGKNDLKYLKIQSDDFEETIECYDDEVIADTKEAEKMRQYIQRDLERAQEDMARAREEMAYAREEMERARIELFRDFRNNKNLGNLDSLIQLKFDGINWDEINAEIEKAMQSVDIETKNIGKEIRKALKGLDVLVPGEEFKQEMRALELELDQMRREIEEEVEKTIEQEFENNAKAKDEARTAKELEKEAEALEKAAKELRKAAKEKAKEAKEKAKEK